MARTFSEQHLRLRLAKNTRRLRGEAGFTLETLAELASMAPRHVQKIEAAEVGATLRTIARLSTALAADPCELLAPITSPSQPGDVARAGRRRI
jgi:transcriptional regulator with XRE-family HTH domain